MTTLAKKQEEVSAPPSSSGFRQRIGPFDATMLVAGSMFGSGIFIVSADIARNVGNVAGLLAIWLLTGLITVCAALCYAELAAMMPHAGGQYVYLREAYSPLWGFLYGWTLFLVIQTGSIAAVGVAFSKFFGTLVPVLGTGPEAVLFKTDGFTITGGQFLAAGLVIFQTLLNCRGVQEGKVVQNVFTVVKKLALVAVIVLGLTMASNATAIQANIQAFWNTPATEAQTKVEKLTGLGSAFSWLMIAGGAMVGSLFASDAWNNITFAAAEVRNPRRTLPIGLICGTGLVIVLYLLANIAYLTALPINGNAETAKYLAAQSKAEHALATESEVKAHWLAATSNRFKAEAVVAEVRGEKSESDILTKQAEEFQRKANSQAEQAEAKQAKANQLTEKRYGEATEELGISHARDDRVGTAIMQLAFPAYGAQLIAIGIIISTSGCLNGMILAGARLYYAMARDGLFFRQVGILNNRGVPAAGLVLQCVWSVLLIFSGTYNQLLDYVIFAALLFYVLTVSGLLVLRRTRPDAERPYRVIGYPIMPLIYIVVCTLIMLNLLVVRPEYTWPGLIIVLTGVPAYFVWRVVGRPLSLMES